MITFQYTFNIDDHILFWNMRWLSYSISDKVIKQQQWPVLLFFNIWLNKNKNGNLSIKKKKLTFISPLVKCERTMTNCDNQTVVGG